MSSTQTDDKNSPPQYYIIVEEPYYKRHSIIISIIALLWIVAGVLAYFWSIACVGLTSNFSHNMYGLITAAFLGPFFFVYLYAMKPYGYCNKVST